MLGCKTRGFSFTRALLGISADELHLCGDPAAVPLIEEILKVTGDNVEVRLIVSSFLVIGLISLLPDILTCYILIQVLINIVFNDEALY